MISDEEITRRNGIALFKRDADPAAWLELSDELTDSAEAAYHHSNGALTLEAWSEIVDGERVQRQRKLLSVSRSYFLLAGFAIENVLKGLLVLDDSTLIESGKLSAGLKSHDLPNLAGRLAHVEMSEDEKELLERLTEAIPYWGRYPIPLAWNQVTPSAALTEETRATFLQLQHRLGQMLYDRLNASREPSLRVWSKKYDPDGSPSSLSRRERE